MDVTAIIESGNRVVVEGAYSGTHTGPLGTPQGEVTICNFPSGELLQRVPFTGRIAQLLFSPDGRYLALAAADRFFHAWQNHDQETGLLLLSDTAKRRSSPGQLESFFSASEPAYEITQGKKMRSGRYNFAVALFESSSTRRARRRFSEIAVVRTGKNDWAIDKLP